MSLAVLLRDPTLTHTFTQFLQSEHNLENYWFWREVQKYKHTFLPSSTREVTPCVLHSATVDNATNTPDADNISDNDSSHSSYSSQSSFDSNNNSSSTFGSYVRDRAVSTSDNQPNSDCAMCMEAQAMGIFHKYMKDDALNISHAIVQAVSEEISKKNFTLTMFDGAQNEVYEMLSLDVFPRFLGSDQYRKVELLKFRRKIRDPQHGFPCNVNTETHQNCFTGDAALSWTLQNGGFAVVTRDHAINLLQRAMDRNEFTVVSGSDNPTQFSESASCLYCFVTDVTKSPEISKESSRNDGLFRTSSDTTTTTTETSRPSVFRTKSEHGSSSPERRSSVLKLRKSKMSQSVDSLLVSAGDASTNALQNQPPNVNLKVLQKKFGEALFVTSSSTPPKDLGNESENKEGAARQQAALAAAPPPSPRQSKKEERFSLDIDHESHGDSPPQSPMSKRQKDMLRLSKIGKRVM